MVKRLRGEDTVVIRFGGGVHSRPLEDEIDIRECVSGENFALDLETFSFRPRPPFDRIGTAPNGAAINGFVTFRASTGAVSFLVQAGGVVYQWDGLSTFTNVASVDAGAKLRGRIEHEWSLDDKVLITDMAGVEVVKEWDGTTFQDVAFTDEAGGAFGTFFAKYCYVTKERATFGNCRDPGGTFPHMVVGSTRGDYTKITVANRPSSSLNESDPFFLLSPDLKPVNGMLHAFRRAIVSTNHGDMFFLDGESAQDFSFEPLYPGSGAAGTESIAHVGNDVFYGRMGRIESLRDTEKFGDIRADDISRPIEDLVSAYTGWTVAYNRRTQRAYCFPDGTSECWAYEKSLRETERQSQYSPWSKYTTVDGFAFQPTAAMAMFDPIDGLEYVFMGDASGNIFRMEGTAGMGDAGYGDIMVRRMSKAVLAPMDAAAFDLEGWVRYRRDQAFTLRLEIMFSGESVYNTVLTLDVPGDTSGVYFGPTNAHFGNGNFFGRRFEGRISNQRFASSGLSNEFQIRATVDGKAAFEVAEVGLRFIAAR